MAVDGQFKQIAEFVALVIQAGAVLVVTFGAVQALALVAEAIWQREADSPRGREIWLQFATWILLALEFALAADLVRTAVAPTWDDIGKLAVIATIRTMLNYFLGQGHRLLRPVQGPGRQAPPRQAKLRRRASPLFVGRPPDSMVQSD
jgi:uncharacterized membrane protein